MKLWYVNLFVSDFERALALPCFETRTAMRCISTSWTTGMPIVDIEAVADQPDLFTS